MGSQWAQLYDAGADRLPATATLHRATDRPLVERITGEARRLTLAVVTSGVDGELLVTAGFGTRVRHGLRLVEGPEPLWERPVGKVLIRSRHLDSRHLDDGLAAPAVRVCGYLIAVTHTGGRSRTTVRGLATAARLLGIALAGTVAMGSAHPRLLRSADETAPANDDAGVAAALEHFFVPGTLSDPPRLHAAAGRVEDPASHAPYRLEAPTARHVSP
ncbi:HAD family hydrolase [Streptomyces sp. NPDC057148]|uniref:HAD family hydrolase n=1 Tax=unclassified Streptomyces TaxID=2593676 RepID=UPI00363ACC5B